jgi:hypothetical protein
MKNLTAVLFGLAIAMGNQTAAAQGKKCGNGVCQTGETCSTCPADCGVCPPVCGDASCNGSETCSSCPADCGACPPPPVCGDATCGGGETCSSCPADCGVCPENQCTVDSDCVPEVCCHASSCVPISQAPACDGVACDAGCNEYTMDCGQGYCACVSGVCAAVIF